MWQEQPLGRNSETVFRPGMVNHPVQIIRLNLNLNQKSPTCILWLNLVTTLNTGNNFNNYLP